MYTKFVNLCKMSQKSLKKHVANKLKETHKDITNGDGFVYAQGEFPVLLVAHLDTVHDLLPSTIWYVEGRDAVSSPQGIGGDDRCGVYMIFEVLKRFNCSVLFCEDEEVGMVGAGKFIKTDLAKELEFNYIIEFDRKGSNDAVFYDCDNEDFEEFITQDFYKTSWGTFSDISTLAPFLGCAAVNLSCGYYDAHQKSEYVILSEMQRSIDEACKILERTTEDDKFEYIEAKHSYNYHYSYSGWSSYNYSGRDKEYDYHSYYSDYNIFAGENYYIIEYVDEMGKTNWFECYGNSEPEAIGKFLMIYQYLTYSHILDVCCDKTVYM